MWRIVSLCALGLGCVAPSLARAQAPRVVLPVGDPGTHHAAHVAGLTADDPVGPVGDPVSYVCEATRAFEPARLRDLQRVEQLLAKAQVDAAALREGRALSGLAEAARLARGLLDLPGIAAWQAEIALRTGLVAAQVGQHGLAETSLRRAASLDLERKPRAAEAAPDVIALSDRIWQAARSAAQGEMTVTVRLDDLESTLRVQDVHPVYVYLDDTLVGTAPTTLHASAGTHVLRVEAPGYRSYGAMLDVLQGKRPDFGVVLAPTRALRAARALRGAGRRGDTAAVIRALSALSESGVPLTGALLVQSGSDPTRAVAVACDTSGCAPARALRAGDAVPMAIGLGSAQAARFLDGDRVLATHHPRAARPRLWQWIGAVGAGVATAVVTGLLVAAQPQPRRELVVVVQPPP